MRWPNLGEVLDPLPWAVIGAVATRLYMPERGTADVDILVGAGDFPAAEARLEAAGWERTGDLTIGGSSWRSPEGIPLDLISSDEPWTLEALSEGQSNRDAQGLPVLPLPYLVLLKLASSRTADVADLSRMLGLADETALTQVRELVGKYVPDDLDDLEALVELGRLEARGQ